MQLEECNYQMRKEIDKLRQELLEKIRFIEEMKEQLYEKNEELEEVKSEMEFYQRKRNDELNKMLEDTF